MRTSRGSRACGGRTRCAVRDDRLPAVSENDYHCRGSELPEGVDVQLHPSQRGNAFWDDFLTNPPVTGFSATR